MKTVRRLLYRDIVWSVVFVALAFLSLFFFMKRCCLFSILIHLLCERIKSFVEFFHLLADLVGVFVFDRFSDFFDLLFDSGLFVRRDLVAHILQALFRLIDGGVRIVCRFGKFSASFSKVCL